jgi:hypothetical protein
MGHKQLNFSPEYEVITNDKEARDLSRQNDREGFEVGSCV